MAGWSSKDMEEIAWDGTIRAKKFVGGDFTINGQTLDDRYVNVTGDTMTGALNLNLGGAALNIGDGVTLASANFPGISGQPSLVIEGFSGGTATIRTNSGSTRTLRVRNSNATNVMNLSVEGEIDTDTGFTLGGVDIFARNNTWTGTNAFNNQVSINNNAGTNPALIVDWNDTGGAVDTGLSLKKEGTERIAIGEYLNLYYGIRAPNTNSDNIFFGIANDTATDFDSYFIATAADLFIQAPSSVVVQIGVNGTEITIGANTMTFENGAADTYIGWGTSGQLDLGVSATSVVEITASQVLIKQELEIDGALDHDGSTVGFYGVTPVARPTGYTQTYSSTTRTHANFTSAQMTDNSGGGNIDAVIDAVIDQGETTGNALINDNFAELTNFCNAIWTDLQNLKNLVNQVIDDLQSNGLLQ